MMLAGEQFQICFSGLTLRFTQPRIPFALSEAFSSLLCHDELEPDAEYEIILLDTPLEPAVPPHHSYFGIDLYQLDEGWLRIHPLQRSKNGCQVACLFCPDGRHTVYYPASRWEEYSRIWCCTHLICGERLLLRHDAVLLHSSVVLYQEKSVLFSGPSGAGKSTQARLWQEYLGATVLNGDRTVIRKIGEDFFGGGSMWSGTSGIFRPDFAPIAGIFLVEQGTENRLERLGFEAFKPLLTQTIVNSWDPAFMSQVTQLLAELMDRIPIYRLTCLPNAEAVELARDTLFPPERSLL